jgi:folylpolyglutamate synthase/dihydropteroate synthase
MVLSRVPMERSADPAAMAAALRSMSTLPVTVAADARAAVLDAIAGATPDETVLITGSLYFLGEVRPAVMQLADERGKNTGLSPATR